MPESVEIHQHGLPDGWDPYVLDHPDGTWYHGSAWKKFVERTFGHPSYYLSVTRSGRLTGVLPLNLVSSMLFGKILVSSSYARYAGVCCDDPESEALLLDGAKSLARQLQVDCLEVRNVPALHDTEFASRTFKQGFRLELPATFEELWRGFRSEIRNRARKAKKAGCESTVCGPEAVDDFYAIFARRMRELGTPAYGRKFFQNLVDIYGGDSRFVVTRRNGIVVGAGLMIFFGDVVEVPWICSLGSEFRSYPNNSMYVEAMRYAIERQARCFDFGSSTKGSGNAMFKQRWGADTIQLHWYYLPVRKADVPDLTPGNPKFSLAIAAWKKLPLSITNLVGPILTRMIP